MRYRFANTVLADRVQRVARQPLRKLGPQERLVGLLRGETRFARAAGLSDDRGGVASTTIRVTRRAGSCRPGRSEGPGGVLQEVCQLKPEEENHRLCLAEWTAMNRPKEKP